MSVAALAEPKLEITLASATSAITRGAREAAARYLLQILAA
jgi:hypothetical protein